MRVNLLYARLDILFLFLLFNGIFLSVLNAQIYPPQLPLSSITWENYQTPSSVPGYLVPFTESLSGNTVIRISDQSVFGCNCSQLRHRYAKNRPWNADETLIMTSGSPAKILDAETYEVVNELFVKSLWSNVDPHLTYDASANSTFASINVITGQQSVIAQFSQYDAISVGYSEGNLSNDDRYVALVGENGNNKTLFVYDMVTDQVVGEKYVGSAGVDWISMSQSGDFVVVSYTSSGTGSTSGIKSYDRNFNNQTHLVSGHPHADIGYDAAGNEVLVHYGNAPGNNSLGYTRLDTGQTTGIFSFSGATGDKGLYGGHVSCRNIDRPGWAYITEQGNPNSVNNNEATREIFAIKLDQSNTIERYAKHNTVTTAGYFHQAHAVPNKNGTKVIFVSNWDNNTMENQTYVPMYVVEVPQNGNNVVDAGDDVSICEGESITLTASGVETYLWSTGETTASITVSPTQTTTYTVIGTDSQNNVTEDSVTVTVNPIPEADAGADVTICAGESTTLTASGGSEYLWDTGATTASINVSPTETTTYIVTVTENGCEDTAQVTVTVNPTPTADAGTDVTINEGESATLTASGGGTYLWNTGETTQSITVSPTATTEYTVTVTLNGCEDTDSVTVFVNAPVNANAGEDVTICEGESTVLTATGGDEYLWSTGETTASITVNPTETTTYTVTVSNAVNSDTDEVTVFVNPTPVADAGVDVTINEGESTTLTASGGGTYLWNTGETTQSITVNPTVTTEYTVTVTLDGCEDTDSVTVFVNATVNADAGEDVTICEGESTVLTATGGDEYLWSTGETSASITVNPSETTTYTVTVSNSVNSDTDEVTVFVNPAPTADAGPDVTINQGESATLTANGGGTYLWSTGETTQSITVSPSNSTTYTVTVNLDGCEDSDSISVFVSSNNEVDAGPDVTICEGESVTLTANGTINYYWSTGETTQSITVSPTVTTTYTVYGYNEFSSNGQSDTVTVFVNPSPDVDAGSDQSICEGDTITLTATGASNYLWDTGETSSSITVSPLVTTTYTVSSTENGCEASDTVTVVVNDVPNASAGEDVSICEGDFVTLTASGGQDYSWSNGAITNEITVSPASTTTYTVTVSNGDCESTDQVTVFVNPNPVANAGPDQSIAAGETVTLTATGGGTYLWNTGETTQSIDVSPNSTTTYTVTVNLNGCQDSDSVTVIVDDEVIADAGEDQTICEGESTTLTASGGTSYLWNTGETTASITVSPGQTTTYTVEVFQGANSDTDSVTVFVDPIPEANAGADQSICQGESITLTATGGGTYQWSTGHTTASITVSPNSTTTYTVTVSNGSCSASDSVTVNVNPAVNANAGSDQSICEGESVTLTASGGDSYLWSTGATSQSITVSPAQTSAYSVTVSQNGCEDTDEVIVTVNENPTANAGPDQSIGPGQSAILSASGGDSYLWSTGDTSPTIIVQPAQTTTYTVTVFSNGCEDTDAVTVTVDDEVVAYAGEDVSICQGDSVVLTASGGTTYLWNTGATTASIQVSPQSTSTYTVIVSTSTGSDSDSVTVFVNPLPNVVVSGDATILEGEFITLSASGANSYEWSNGATQPNIAVSPSATTTYFVTGFINDCSSTEDVTVNVVEQVDASAGEDQSICLGETITLTASGGDAYLWNNGETTQSIDVSPTEDTMYTVIVSNELDSDAAEVMVTVEQCDPEETPLDYPSFEFIVHEVNGPNQMNAMITGLRYDAMFSIHDITGKLIYSQKLSANNGQRQDIPINSGGHAQGIYVVTIVEKSVVRRKKIVFR